MSEQEMTMRDKLSSAMDGCSEVEALMLDITDAISTYQLNIDDAVSNDEITESPDEDDKELLVDKFTRAIEHLKCAMSKFTKDER